MPFRQVCGDEGSVSDLPPILKLGPPHGTTPGTTFTRNNLHTAILQPRIRPGRKKKKDFHLSSFCLDYPFSCLFLRSRYLKFRFSSSTTMQNIRDSFTIYKLSKCRHLWALPVFLLVVCFQIWLRKWLWMVSVELEGQQGLASVPRQCN